MAAFLNQIKAAIQGEEQQEKGLLQQVDEAVTLTWTQRLIGFGICMGMGILLSIVSMIMLWSANITRFAIFYSIGNVLSIGSTMFLMGPIKQIQRMFEAKRAIATSVFLVTIIVTLVLAFKTHNAGLCLVMLVIQFCALAYYCVTWIPGGTAAVKALITGAT